MISFRVSDQGLTAGTNEGTRTASADLFDAFTADGAGIPLAVTDQDILHFESTFLPKKVGLVESPAFGQAGFKPPLNCCVKTRDIRV